MKNIILLLLIPTLLISCKKDSMPNAPVREMTIHLTAETVPYQGWTLLTAVFVNADKICDSLKGTVTVQFDRYTQFGFADRDTAIVQLVNYETSSVNETDLQYSEPAPANTAKIIAVHATGAIITW